MIGSNAMAGHLCSFSLRSLHHRTISHWFTGHCSRIRCSSAKLPQPQSRPDVDTLLQRLQSSRPGQQGVVADFSPLQAAEQTLQSELQLPSALVRSRRRSAPGLP